jgi:hypothetical protein
VAVDATTNETPFVTPPLQLYEVAPVPLKVTDDPEHTVEAGDVIVPTVGNGFTVMVIVPVPLHPFNVPVTV